jgi:hypothetical protein
MMPAKEVAMSIPLNEEQQRALDAPGDELVRLVDPRTNQTYVLVKEEVFARMRQVVDGFARSAGWDDPELDVYEQYRDRP